MPKELIATATVTDDTTFRRDLSVAWGVKGGCPEAPDGWVNAGYAELHLREDYGDRADIIGVHLDPSEIDHLIRVLKRVKRYAYPTV